jgi:hypothetical protein
VSGHDDLGVVLVDKVSEQPSEVPLGLWMQVHLRFFDSDRV